MGADATRHWVAARDLREPPRHRAECKKGTTTRPERRCAACAALADCARYGDGARSLGPALAVFVAPLIPSPSIACRRKGSHSKGAGDLGPLLACAAVGELAARDHTSTRPSLIKAGCVENLVRAILDALQDSKDLGGDSSACLLYTSPSPRDQRGSRMPSSA